MKNALDFIREELAEHFHPWSDWRRWEVVLKATFAIPMQPPERQVFKLLTGLSSPATTRAREALILAGRGAGKTKISAVICIVMAVLFDWSHLKRKARVLLLAVDREQAQEALEFVRLFFEAPKLAALVAERTKSSITLVNSIVIQVKTASPRGIRGPSVVAAVVDECAFLPREPSINSDVKLYRALRPALDKVPGSLLVSISSTGERSGVAYDLHEKYYAQPDSPVLVFRAKSSDLNTTKDHKLARQRAFQLDPYSAAAEFDSEWFADEAAFISRDRVQVIGDKNPTPPQRCPLFVGLDPNGGSEKGDAFAMATAWIEGGRIKVGLIESRSGKKDPVSTIEEFASILRPYRRRIMATVSDRYAAGYVPATFRRQGMSVQGPHRKPRIAGGGRMSQSDYFLAMLGRLRQVDFPDDARLLGELHDLVRGPDGVSHPNGKHDDLIGAAARAIHACGLALDRMNAEAITDDEPEDEAEAERREWERRPLGMVLPGDRLLMAEETGEHLTELQQRILRSEGNDYSAEFARGFWSDRNLTMVH